MPLGECANRHLYNKHKHGDTCPICGLVSRKAKEEGKTAQEIEAMLKIPEDKHVRGWLICIKGINRGRAYAIHSGRNFIGSGDDMDIQIMGDDKVYPYRHAAIAYDTVTQEAALLPGDSEGLAYLEGTVVYVPCKLGEHSEIEIGSTVFRYKPFRCGVQQSEKEASVWE